MNGMDDKNDPVIPVILVRNKKVINPVNYWLK